MERRSKITEGKVTVCEHWAQCEQIHWSLHPKTCLEGDLEYKTGFVFPKSVYTQAAQWLSG